MIRVNEQEIDNWNKKVNKLKEHIMKEFPIGCKGMECKTCMLRKKRGVYDPDSEFNNPLCELLDIGINHVNIQRNSTE